MINLNIEIFFTNKMVMFQSTPPLARGRQATKHCKHKTIPLSPCGWAHLAFDSGIKFCRPTCFYAVQLPDSENRFNEPKLTQFSTCHRGDCAGLRHPALISPLHFGSQSGCTAGLRNARHLRGWVRQHRSIYPSGSTAPQVRDPIEAYSKLSDAAFIQSVSSTAECP